MLEIIQKIKQHVKYKIRLMVVMPGINHAFKLTKHNLIQTNYRLFLQKYLTLIICL